MVPVVQELRTKKKIQVVLGNFSLWNLRQILNSHMPVAEKSDEVSLASELSTAIASNPDNFSNENKSKLKQGSQPEIPERGSKTESEAKAAWGPAGRHGALTPWPCGAAPDSSYASLKM